MDKTQDIVFEKKLFIYLVFFLLICYNEIQPLPDRGTGREEGMVFVFGPMSSAGRTGMKSTDNRRFCNDTGN